jgi:hypothetical protein
MVIADRGVISTAGGRHGSRPRAATSNEDGASKEDDGVERRS